MPTVTTDKPAALTPRQKSNLNLKPFKKGDSGNPKGRPRVMTESLDFWLGQPVPDTLLVGKLEHLKGSGVTFADICAFNIVLTAALPSLRNPAASVAAFKEVSDRIEGKVPLTIKGTMDHTHTDVSAEELEARLRAVLNEIPTIEGEVISETISEKQLDARAKPLQLHDGESSETFNSQPEAHSDVCLVDEGDAELE